MMSAQTFDTVLAVVDQAGGTNEALALLVELLREFAEAAPVRHHINVDTWACCGHHVNFDNVEDPTSHFDTCRRARARKLLEIS